MSDAPESQRDEAVAAALEEYHRRRALGEPICVEDWLPRLGDAYAEFSSIVAAEEALDRAMSGPSPQALPRPLGHYTLLRELGRGGVGVVYEALDRRLGRRAAVKVLKAGIADEPSALARFRREASACARVRHDHIVPIFEAGDLEGHAFYAMDIVPGESLASMTAHGRLPPLKDLCRELAAVADALHALHRAGVIHRDVKPSNLIVRPDGRILLADFGLARTAESATLTRSGDALGTPLYMSPEQMLGRKEEVDARTDVYGLGATLYEAVTHRPPFQGEDLASLARLILSQRPTPPGDLVPGLDPAVERIALKALEKRREDRYADAAEMAADLRAFAEGGHVVGRPVPTVIRAARVLRRRWLPISVAAAVVAGSIAWWTNRSAEIVVAGYGAEIPIQVFVNGEARGPAPLSVAVARGDHRVRMVPDPRFGVPYERTVRLGAGERSAPLLAPLKPATREAETVVIRLVARLPDLELPPPTRAAAPDSPAVDFLFPRGDVRIEDLATACVVVDTDVEGRIEWRRGGEMLAATPFTPRFAVSRVAVPKAAIAALRTGDRCVWTFVPAANSEGAGPHAKAEFRVVEVDLSKERAQLDRTLARDADRARALATASILRTSGLETASFLASYGVARSDPTDDRGWANVLDILKGWGETTSAFYQDAVAFLRSTPRDASQAPTLEESSRGPK